ncbi:MAG TPA: ABC transporter substrate-binding protein, partial [Thermoprotei archaeon]|nr:ABC transporter substrate-binding protein [Thermoprotei archaeon]
MATGVSEFPSNDSFIVYLRKGLDWYNGSATMPFSAWDVYTYFYIEAKVFHGYWPYLNASKLRILNNYTIEFTLNEWAPTIPGLLLQNIISTPYEVWKPILVNLTTMNSSQALAYASTIEHFVAPGWFLGPYYDTVSPPYVIMNLDPGSLLEAWAQVFPYHTWQDYNREVIYWWTAGGSGTILNGILAHKISWIQSGQSPANFGVIAKTGFKLYLKDGYMGDFDMMINPAVYPLNITNVRLALAYAVNRTEMVDSWNADNMTLYVPWTYAGFWPNYASLPKWIYKDMYNFTTNLTKATELLESAGLYKKGGQWYLPNGQPFKLTFTVINGWLDTATQWEN